MITKIKMTMIQKIKLGSLREFLFVFGLVLLGLSGCEQQSDQRVVNTDFLDRSIESVHNLGWLGAKSHPLNDAVKFLEPDSPENGTMVSPGGIVLTEVVDGEPLSDIGLRPGDVVVRIDDDWVPIKEDSTLDVIGAIENLISANRENVTIGYLRMGEFSSANLPIDRQSVDEGLPLPSQRLADVATNCLRNLSKLQRKDGSFSTESGSRADKLKSTSICGLAFLAADDSVREEFDSNVEACIEFVGLNLRFDGVDSAEEKLDALTAAYLAQFLAESRVQVMDEDWLDKIGGLLDLLDSEQQQSGGWGTSISSPESEDGQAGTSEAATATDEPIRRGLEAEATVDVAGTFTTNQVLMALGAWERKGMIPDNSTIEKGCKYLAEQADLRIPSSLDRRIKAVLSSGSAAALVAINCDRNDVMLDGYLENGMDRAHDMFSSPSLGLAGLLHTAIAARQVGNERWLQFHNAVKHLIISLADSNGRVFEYPNIIREPLDFEVGVDDEVWRTAHIAIVASMQSKQLEKILGIAKSPTMFARNNLGEKVEANARSNQPVMGSTEAEELKKMIMEQLKAQGMEIDESKMKIQSAPKK